MKRKLLSIGVSFLLFTLSAQAQVISETQNVKALRTKTAKVSHSVPTHFIPAPNMEQIQAEDAVNDAKGMLYRIGVPSFTNLTQSNSGLWTTLPSGEKMWQLVIKNPGAEALSFIFSSFNLSEGSTFWVQTKEGKMISKVLTRADMQEDLQQNIALCFGDELVLTLVDQPYANPSEFTMDRVMYNYRSTGNPGPEKINESGSCEVNVNCPEGTTYQEEKKGVARIYVVDSSGAGWCTGTLMNNTANDCKPLFLTALHCGPTTSTANFNLWKFYFNYETVSCTVNPSTEGTLDDYFITGCVKLASSNDNTSGNIMRDDFLLLQLGTLANQAATVTTLKSANFGAYWNGWDANNTASTSGVGIHHPAGDTKKISTYTAAVVSDSYSGSTANTHWRANWVATATNYGVTEGGSSGSALFTGNGGNSRVIGTLSGGASSCTATAANKNDLYGKMSYHWVGNGTTSALSLKYHLDPGNTGVLVFNGSSNPCSAPATPVANFSADDVTPCVGASVIFSDLSTGTPTSWGWTFNPSTVTYTGGTSASSQNPHVQFNAAGAYTVTLVATNGIGNDSEIKTAYINPYASTGAALPVIENFESATFPPTGWTIENSDAPSIAWGTAGEKGIERAAAAGNTGSTSGSAAINCYDYNTDITLVDNMITKSISLTGATAPKMTFKRAYKNYVDATAPTDYQDELRIYVSSDCGATYGSALYTKIGSQLATNGSLTTTFTPSVAADWDIDTVNLTAYIGQNVLIKFEVSSKYGNNLYLDDINITNTIAAVASVSIASSDADNTICAGASVTFTATPTNGGTAPSYQWKVNGANVGTNSATYTTTTLTTGQSVTCVMTSNLAGVTASPATSNAIVTTVNTIPSTPVITTNSPVCTGTAINLGTAAAASATYAWTGPNTFINATQNPTIASATSAMAGTYNLTITVNGCTSVAGTSSVIVNTSVTPAVSIALTSGSNPTCASQSVTFTATPTNGGVTPAYQWQVNGVNAGTNSTTFTPASVTNNDAITCILTSNAACISSATATSNAVTLSVTTSLTPLVAIAASNTSICSGTSVTFTATPTNGGSAPTYQWQVNGSNAGTGGISYASSTLANNDIITCIMTSNATCITSSTATSNAVTMTVNAIPSTPAITTNSPICSGSAINLSTPAAASATYAWSGPNSFTDGSQSPTITSASASMTGNYNLTITVNGCTSTAGTASVTVNPIITPSTSISITTGGNPTCASQSVTYTAIPVNGGTMPSYQWLVNGVNAGTNSANFTPVSITDNDVISCVMTSNAACTSSATATSNAITMTISTSVVPSVSIAADNNPVCSGTTVTFTATATNGGASPTYQWMINGANVGTNNAVYTNSSIANNDIVTCIMTSNSPCASTATATSNAITISITSGVVPSVAIAASSTTICTGTNVTFTATSTNGGSSPAYQWEVNSSPVGTNSTSFSSSSLANNDIITCILTSNASCASTTTVTSNTVTMSVGTGATPAISVTMTNGTNPSCQGTSVTYTATATNGGTAPAYQWQVNGSNVGSNNPAFTTSSLADNDIVSCILTSNASCLSSATATSTGTTMSITTSATPTITIALSSGTMPSCPGTPLTFTATSGNGGSSPQYQWQVNGVNAGTNSTTFTSSALANNDAVTCVLTSNSLCAAVSNVTSNTISASVSTGSTPTLTISPSSSSSCTGSAITFTTSFTNGGTAPTFVWNLNGGPAATGSTYVTSSLTSIDVVNCIMTSDATCLTTQTATSNNVSVMMNTPVTPTISSLILSGANPSCQGSNIIFAASTTNSGTNPTYQWQINGVNAGNNNSTFATTNLANNDIVTCTLTSSAGCLTAPNVTSTGIAMGINPIPSTPTITTSAGGTTLTSSSTTGNQWYLNGIMLMGLNTQTITATQNGNYTVIVSNGNCSSPASSVNAVNSVGINEIADNDMHFTVYPNPSSGKFTVVYTSNDVLKFKIELQNVLGQTIHTEDTQNFNGTFTKEFDITDYGKGQYFIIFTDSKQNKIEKLIVY